MSGPEHYQEAERILAALKKSGHTPALWAVVAAQAHATLAAAAAAATAIDGRVSPDWSEALS